MVTGDVYRIDRLTRVCAVIRALQSTALELLGEHMAGCVVGAARTGRDEGAATAQEAAQAIARLVRS